MTQMFFEDSVWLGKGDWQLQKTSTPLWIRYIMQFCKEQEAFTCTMEFQMTKNQEHVQNHYTFFPKNESEFAVILKNPEWGESIGKGWIEENSICIEYPKGPHGFQGFESYSLQEDQSFDFHSEFLTEQGLHSILHAKGVRTI